MCRILKNNSLDKSEIQPCSPACSVQDCHFSTSGHRELKLVSSQLKYLNLLDSDDKNGLIKRLLGTLKLFLGHLYRSNFTKRSDLKTSF